MDSIDLVILAVLAFFIFKGLRKGFFREILGLLGWVGGIIIAIQGFTPFSRVVEHFLPHLPRVIIPIISFVSLFLIIYLISRFLASGLSELSRTLHLGWLNRLLGAAASGLKGALILSLLFLFLSILPIKGQLNAIKQQSVLYRPIENMVPALYSMSTELSMDTQKLQERLFQVYRQGEEKLKEEAIKRFLNSGSDSTQAR